MYTSNDGNIFELYDRCKHCYKCDAATIVCPHAVVPDEAMALPPKTTHIKFIHPLLKLKTTFDYTSFEKTSAEHQQFCEKRLELSEYDNPNVTPTFFKIWGEFYNNRGGIKPRSNRIFSTQKTLGLIQEIYSYRWIQEESVGDVDDPDELNFPTFSVIIYIILGNLLFSFPQLVSDKRCWNEGYSR